MRFLWQCITIYCGKRLLSSTWWRRAWRWARAVGGQIAARDAVVMALPLARAAEQPAGPRRVRGSGRPRGPRALSAHLICAQSREGVGVVLRGKDPRPTAADRAAVAAARLLGGAEQLASADARLSAHVHPDLCGAVHSQRRWLLPPVCAHQSVVLFCALLEARVAEAALAAGGAAARRADRSGRRALRRVEPTMGATAESVSLADSDSNDIKIAP